MTVVIIGVLLAVAATIAFATVTLSRAAAMVVVTSELKARREGEAQPSGRPFPIVTVPFWLDAEKVKELDGLIGCRYLLVRSNTETIGIKWPPSLCDESVDDLAHEVGSLTTQLKQLGERMETALQQLKNQVANNTSVINSALQLVQGLRAQLQAAIDSSDEAALQDLANQLEASDVALAAAVAANTVAAEPTAAATPADPAPEVVPQ